mgnify:CR=1 FL=1
MMASIFKTKELLNFKILFVLNIICLVIVNQYPDLIFFVISSIFLGIIIFSCKHYLYTFYALVIFFSYQLTFYMQLFLSIYDIKSITIGNFYTYFNYDDIFKIYKPIHFIVSIFILALISFSDFLKIEKKIFYLQDDIKKKISILFFLLNLFLFMILIFDFFNVGANVSQRTGVFFKLMSLDMIGQLIRKLYYLNYFFLAFFAFEKKLFKPIVFFSYFTVLTIALVNTSRLETIFLLIIFVIYIYDYVKYKKYLLLFFLCLPIIWTLIGNIRRFVYRGETYLDNLFNSYFDAVSSIIGRISYLYEVSIIYYTRLHGNISEFNYIWQSLIPSKFLKDKMSFYADDYQMMIDLHLTDNLYPYSNTADLGIIGESFYFLGDNFWILPLIVSLIIYIILYNIQSLEKNFQNSFTLYFIFTFGLKGSIIGSSLDFLFLLLFILLPVKIYTKIINKN